MPIKRETKRIAPKPLYRIVDEDFIPSSIRSAKNRHKSWAYGYNKEFDMVVISKSGQIGDIYEIEGLLIALPKYDSKEVKKRSNSRKEQYWERDEVPDELQKIKSIFEWNAKHSDFKSRWIEHIENEFDKRERGVFFMNDGEPTYITGSHHFYLSCASIDVGFPDFREANRILFIFWEACKADYRSFGISYLKIRRSGASYMMSSEGVNEATLAIKGHVGILSKTGKDAKSMFTDKVVNINSNLPFYFKPVQDGMDRPKTELAYRIPAKKITRKNMSDSSDVGVDGLDTIITWLNTEDNSYDSQKLLLLLHDESGKWMKPANILNNWRITKTCLRLGRKIIGKCFMASTSNALDKGGREFKSLFNDSKIATRNKNGQTKSGLYALFIPMEWNTEGYIDIYGHPVMFRPDEPIMGIDGELIEEGAIDWWEAECEGLRNDSDALNEFMRQFPRTEQHAFRDESKESIFNLTKIYTQYDHNESSHDTLQRGGFVWKNGIKDTEVLWMPDKKGRFIISQQIPEKLRNNVVMKNGKKTPGNINIGAFGCDSYDISGTVDGGGSKAALHGLSGFHFEDFAVNEFFCEYIARPDTAEEMFEDVLMAIVYFGMPILAENNKPRLLYHLKNRGYRKFSLNRPDKHFSRLSKTEKELGGVPSSTDVIATHATAIESWIEEFVGYDYSGKYRNPEEMGVMPFQRTLEDWTKFKISERTKRDASVSSGLAIMAVRRSMYKPEAPQDENISINFASYDNRSLDSKLNVIDE